MGSNSTLKYAILNSRRQRTNMMLLQKIEANKRMKRDSLMKEETSISEMNVGRNEISFGHQSHQNPSTSSQTYFSSHQDENEIESKSSADKYIDTLSRMLENEEVSLSVYIHLSNIYLNLKKNQNVPKNDSEVSSTTTNTKKSSKDRVGRMKNWISFTLLCSLLILICMSLMPSIGNAISHCKLSDIKCIFEYGYKSIYGFQEEKSHEFPQLKHNQGLNFIDLINETAKPNRNMNQTDNDQTDYDQLTI